MFTNSCTVFKLILTMIACYFRRTSTQMLIVLLQTAGHGWLYCLTHQCRLLSNASNYHCLQNFGYNVTDTSFKSDYFLNFFFKVLKGWIKTFSSVFPVYCFCPQKCRKVNTVEFNILSKVFAAGNYWIVNFVLSKLFSLSLILCFLLLHPHTYTDFCIMWIAIVVIWKQNSCEMKSLYFLPLLF